MTRRYGIWNGNPRGTPENIGHCIEEVRPRSGFEIPRQCNSSRGHGPDGLRCRRHAKKYMEKLNRRRQQDARERVLREAMFEGPGAAEPSRSDGERVIIPRSPFMDEAQRYTREAFGGSLADEPAEGAKPGAPPAGPR